MPLVLTSDTSKGLAAALSNPAQELMHQLVERIVLTTSSVKIQLSKEGLLFHLPIDEEPECWKQTQLSIYEPMVLRRRGQETKLILGAQDEPASNPDETLIHLIARASFSKSSWRPVIYPRWPSSLKCKTLIRAI